MDRKLFVGSLFLVFLFITVPYLGCGGGGGGDDVVDDEPGGVGIGADGVTVFWRYYTGQNYGAGSAAQETDDGGYILTGNKGPEIETQDVYLFKTDDEGTLEWELPYPTSGWDGARAVRQTADGGYIIAGYNDKPAGDEDFLLIKTDGSGAQSWMSTLDNGFAQEGRSVWPVDGGYLFLGNSYVNHPGNIWDWDACTYSVDNGGAWAGTVDCFGGADIHELAYAMEEAGDGGYIVTGAKGVIGYSVWLVKTDSSGEMEWQETYGSGTAYAVRAVDEDGDGFADDGFVIAGKDANPFEGGSAKLLVIRTDASGKELWRKIFGGSGYDCANAVAVAGTSGVVIAGQTDSFSDFPMLYLIKLDMDGEVLWQKVKGDAENYDMVNSAREVSDGGFILAAGYGDMLVKTDKNGDTVDLGERDVTMTIPSVTGLIDFANAVEAASGAVDSLLQPWSMGNMGLEWVLAVMDGATEGEICDISGSGFAITPYPTAPVSEGDAFELTFSACSSTALGATVIFDGVVSVSIDSLTGIFSPSSTSYAVETEITTTGFDVEDDLETLTFTGGLRFARIRSSGAKTEVAWNLAAGSLAATNGTVTRTLTAFSVTTESSASEVTLGEPGETVLYSHSSPALTATITLEIQETVAFDPMMDEPASGAFTATAPDDSSLTVTFDDGSADIAVDTDGDGSADGNIGASWETLN